MGRFGQIKRILNIKVRVENNLDLAEDWVEHALMLGVTRYFNICEGCMDWVGLDYFKLENISLKDLRKSQVA